MKYKTSTGFEVELKQIPNITIFEYIADCNLVVPKPPLWERIPASNGQPAVWEPNEYHPLYHDAMLVYDVQRHNVAINAIVSSCFEISDKSQFDSYIPLYAIAKRFLSKYETFETWVLRNFIVTDADLMTQVDNCILTEQRVGRIFSSISVKRDGINIHQANLKHAVNTNIDVDAIVIAGYQLVSPLDELRGCNFSGMEWQSWLRCEYTLKEKASAIALMRLDKTIETHNNDAVQIFSEREAKRKNKG